MAFTLSYSEIWKKVSYNWTTYNIFWESSVNLPDGWSGWTILETYNSVSASWLSVWDYVGAYIWKVTSDTATRALLKVSIQAYYNSSWETRRVVFNRYLNFSWEDTWVFWTFVKIWKEIDDSATNYRIKIEVDSKTWYQTFTVTNTPSWSWGISMTDKATWKSLVVNWSVVQTAYGKTFNREPAYSGWWNWSNWTCSWETSFDLTNFQIGNEVLCFSINLRAGSTANWKKLTVSCQVQKSKNSEWVSDWMWRLERSDTVNSWYTYAYSWYMGIDKDEIWNDATSYRLKWNWECTNGDTGFTYSFFDISNLSIDTTICPAWALWVEWNHLCYTDNILEEIWYNGYGYKHKIWYQSWYSSYVWTDKSWMIWIQDSGSYADRIHYVDSSWYHRATDLPLWWYWWYATAPWKQWYLWVWAYNADYWYWYLCFVDSSWVKHRIMNPDLSS